MHSLVVYKLRTPSFLVVHAHRVNVLRLIFHPCMPTWDKLSVASFSIVINRCQPGPLVRNLICRFIISGLRSV